MKELLTIFGTASLAFVLAGVAAVTGVVKRHKNLKWTALGLFILAGCLAGWAGFRLATKSYHKLAEVARPRTGDEIYAALFGEKQAACVSVLHYQDQAVPKIDYAIWLQFETCPAELKRILALHQFTRQKQIAAGWGTAGPPWFKPETLGDSVLIFRYQGDNYGSGQTIFASLDSTKVFCSEASE